MRTRIITAALAMSLLGATAANAQAGSSMFDFRPAITAIADRGDWRDDRRDYRDDRRDDRRDYRDDRRDDRRDYRAERRDDRRDYRADRRYDRRYDRPDWRDYRRGGQAYRYDRHEFRRFHRGDRFYYQPHRHVIVNDWHRYHLHSPPRGYHWVRNGDSGDFLLVAVATGLILELMFNGY